MPINFPDTQKETIDRVRTDVQGELPQSNPFLPVSFLNALMVAFGQRINEVYLQMQELLKQMFQDTATGDFQKRWGALVNVFQNAASVSKGNVTATGVIGSVIPINSLLASPGGNQYQVLQTVDIDVNANDITSLTFNSGTVTAITDTEHGYASGIQVSIAGATQPEYNGTFSIFVTSKNSFTYEISGSPATPATGLPFAAANTATVAVQSVDFGLDQNLDSGAALTWVTSLPGVDSTAYVQFDEIAGGADAEEPDDLQIRITEKWQNPPATFNKAEIIDTAKEVTGVTRVFVYSPDDVSGINAISSLTQSNNIAIATTSAPHTLISGMVVAINGAIQPEYNVQDAMVLVIDSTHFIYLIQGNPASPATGTILAQYALVQPGQVRVSFTRDNDPDIIPSGANVTDVLNKLLTIKPAHMSTKNLIVEAPIPVPVQFTFSSITPNSPTMQAAITANLEQFFRESTVEGQNLLKLAYDAAIFNTVDPETGEALQDFVLTTPTLDIVILEGQLPTLQGVNFL